VGNLRQRGKLQDVVVDARININVKCTLVQVLRLCTGRTAHRVSRGLAILYRH